MTAAAAPSLLPISICRSTCKFYATKSVPGRGGFRVVAVLGEEAGGRRAERKGTWEAIFDVEDPRPRMPLSTGKFLDANKAMEVVRFDIQYCDWRARHDLLTIILLHDKVVEVLNPLAREYRSIGTTKKELAQLQEELALAHKQVHLSESRISYTLDKLAHMEALVSDKQLQDRGATETNSDHTPLTPSASSASQNVMTKELPRKSLKVSGPAKTYHPGLKNFWYPVAFSSDLKDDTMIVSKSHGSYFVEKMEGRAVFRIRVLIERAHFTLVQ